jgi:glycosyltransferase involved in cell wall biosynthesis
MARGNHTVSGHRLRIGILGDPKDVHVRRWCAGLASRGLEVCNICGSLPSERIPGIEYWEFCTPAFGLRYPYRRSVRLRHYIAELFRHFDIIHMHNLHNWGIDGPIPSGGHLVVSTYGGDVLPPIVPPGKGSPVIDRSEHTARMKQSVLSLADHITATSSFLADATSKYGHIPRGQIEVINFGVDPEQFMPRLVERTETGHVGFCGGFSPHKGARELVEAAPLVWKHWPCCRFSLYGPHRSQTDLVELVAHRGYGDGICLYDSVLHERLPWIIDAFDVHVVPTVHAQEAYGVLAVEAQALEVPVVASRIGGLPDTVLHERTGLLVEPGSPKELASGICELLSDEPKRRRLGRTGREWVKKKHNWSDSLDRMIAAYERVMAGYSRRASFPGTREAELACSC